MNSFPIISNYCKGIRFPFVPKIIIDIHLQNCCQFISCYDNLRKNDRMKGPWAGVFEFLPTKDNWEQEQEKFIPIPCHSWNSKELASPFRLLHSFLHDFHPENKQRLMLECWLTKSIKYLCIPEVDLPVLSTGHEVVCVPGDVNPRHWVFVMLQALQLNPLNAVPDLQL